MRAQRIKRITNQEQKHIAECANAVRLGGTKDYVQVAIATGYHPVDAAKILRRYREMYNPVTVQIYGREVM